MSNVDWDARERAYVNDIKNNDALSFEYIRKRAWLDLNILDNEEKVELWKSLNRGEKKLNIHQEMCGYLYWYGRKHAERMNIALDEIPISELNSKNIKIIDYGCGQGLATIKFLDRFIQYGNNIIEITLIDPSRRVLERAKLHISQYERKLNSHLKVNLLVKTLDEITIEDLCSDSEITFHLFSNILDIYNIDLFGLVRKLGKSMQKINYFVCVGPNIPKNDRIEQFEDLFMASERVNFGEERKLKFNRNLNENLDINCKVFKLEQDKIRSKKLVNDALYRYMFAGYQLDIVKKYYDKEILKQEYDGCMKFKVAATFDIAATPFDDIHPILAVLNNIIVRGLPTKASPFIEECFAKILPNERIGNDFEIEYDVLNRKNIDQYKELLIYSPIAIARLQKIILEAFITKQLSLDVKKLKILVIERDVPCAAIAIEDFRQIFNNLTALSRDYKEYSLPDIELTVISNKKYKSSALHLEAKIIDYYDKDKANNYDLVVDMAVIDYQQDRIKIVGENLKVLVDFNDRNKGINRVYTTDCIIYDDLVSKNAQGEYIEISESKEHLKFFLQLLFRKMDFRKGQLPILSRALQKKCVIGLLPTGAGKSLTYQLAAMLQPGICLVVDPLQALMEDQYNSLLNLGISNCSFINASLNDVEYDKFNKYLEESSYQFIFLSPERLCMEGFRNKLLFMHNLGIYFSYGVIDEVHCVSEWGHDFRTPYLHLGNNLYKYVLPKVNEVEKFITLFGLTATASFDVLADVERELSGNGKFKLDIDTIVRDENTNRLEIQYKIEALYYNYDEDIGYSPRNEMLRKLPKAILLPSDEDMQDGYNNYFVSKKFSVYDSLNKLPLYFEELKNKINLNNIIHKFFTRQNKNIEDCSLVCDDIQPFVFDKFRYDQAGIIFCPVKAENRELGVPKVAKVVELKCDLKKGAKSKVGQYYSASDRFVTEKEKQYLRENIKLFKNNLTPIMVATKAFGMGIDKSNIRFTINMNYSSSIEAFVQEAGRAGRDKHLALSMILFSADKFARVVDSYPGNKEFIKELQGYWFKEDDLKYIFKSMGCEYKEQHVEIKLASEYDRDVLLFFYNKNFNKNRELRTQENLLKYRTLRYDIGDNKTQNADNWLKIILESNINKTFDVHIRINDNEAIIIYRMIVVGLIKAFRINYRENEYIVTFG